MSVCSNSDIAATLSNVLPRLLPNTLLISSDKFTTRVLNYPLTEYCPRRRKLKKKRISPRETLAINLAFLKQRFGYSDREIGKRAGISPKSVNNMYNERTDVQLESVDAVAKVFGLGLWHLLMPDLEVDYEDLADFENLREGWIASSDDGKKQILSIASFTAISNKPDKQ